MALVSTRSDVCIGLFIGHQSFPPKPPTSAFSHCLIGAIIGLLCLLLSIIYFGVRAKDRRMWVHGAMPLGRMIALHRNELAAYDL